MGSIYIDNFSTIKIEEKKRIIDWFGWFSVLNIMGENRPF